MSDPETASPADLPAYITSPVRDALDRLHAHLVQANNTIDQYLSLPEGANSKHLADWHRRQEVCAKAVWALMAVLDMIPADKTAPSIIENSSLQDGIAR
jgi:hypothetical protein